MYLMAGQGNPVESLQLTKDPEVVFPLALNLLCLVVRRRQLTAHAVRHRARTRSDAVHTLWLVTGGQGSRGVIAKGCESVVSSQRSLVHGLSVV